MMQNQYGGQYGGQYGAQPSNKISLSIECSKLPKLDKGSNSDPMCVVFEEDPVSKTWKEIGRTEVVKDNLNPHFAKHFVVNYYFEREQRFKFEVYDCDNASIRDLSRHDFIGKAHFVLAELVAAKGGQKHARLSNPRRPKRDNGIITVATEEVNIVRNETLTLSFSATNLDKKDFLGKSDPYLCFYRAKESGWTKVHQTEIIKKTLNPTWKTFSISLAKLCNGDKERTIKIECFDWDANGSHDFIGSCTTSVSQFSSSKKSWNLINEKLKKKKGRKYKNSGVLSLNRFDSVVQYNFLEYVQGMCEINLMISVDFTASNGNPTNSSSLHYNNPQQPNEYARAIQAVGNIVSYYDHDKRFPTYGFGAKMPNGQVSHCFHVNMQPQNPECVTIQGVLNAYRNCLNQVQLYGPTNFAPTIRQAIAIARQNPCTQQHQKYLIVLILTDGEITDMSATKEAIIDASSLPISIIIVGVGTGCDFKKMDELDSDNGALRVGNKIAERDIVQFVPMNQFVNKHFSELAKHTLQEIPKQFKSFMTKYKIKPNPRPPPPPIQAQFFVPQGQHPPQQYQQQPPRQQQGQQGQHPPQQQGQYQQRQPPPQQQGQYQQRQPPQQQGQYQSSPQQQQGQHPSQQPPQQQGQQYQPQGQYQQRQPPQQQGQYQSSPQQQGQHPSQQQQQGQHPSQGQYQQGQHPPQQPPQQGQQYQPQQGQYQSSPQQQGQHPPQGQQYQPQQGQYQSSPQQQQYQQRQQYQQQGQQYPPQGQYPPQQQYPPQGQYPPQQQYPPQGQYQQYPTQGQYPPQQQYPPQGQYQQYSQQPPSNQNQQK